MCGLKKHEYAELPPSENHVSLEKNVHTNMRNSAFPRALNVYSFLGFLSLVTMSLT